VTILLRADSIAKSFTGRRVLSAATLRAVPGELRVLFGRNGIGKSTLLQIAAGVQQPDGGVVEFGGRARLRVTLPMLAREGLFFLPDRDLLSPKFPVRRQLEFFRRQFSGADIEESAERMGIAARLDQLPPSLSGGELRRAELATVLVRRPTCLLADEPYRGVAPADAEVLTCTFRALAANGCAVVVTGHEVPTLMDAADHVSWCTTGTTYELGPPVLAATHEAFRREYLGAWYRS
jgi:ABC-type multidrug transport system ATPase subunit